MQNNSNLQLASMRSRAFAYVIDDFIVTIIAMIVFWDSVVAASYDSQVLINLIQSQIVIPLIVIKIVYQTFFVWYYGATIGKIITKIRVIDSYHWGRVSFISSLIRSIGRIFSEMIFYIGFLIGFFNDGRKTFHDFTGKTLVVNA